MSDVRSKKQEGWLSPRDSLNRYIGKMSLGSARGSRAGDGGPAIAD